ncbi:uncharacterized protein LOC131804767 [Musca domestica]|uniref:Uncharacterized protein LOC131804767 n=1 Tax=Musca domestica TaxID=7370 RepID=A0ABM3VDQ0_MUSDO|nr:uncharacterized protein LOC131804767 [Musca domestica]
MSSQDETKEREEKLEDEHIKKYGLKIKLLVLHCRGEISELGHKIAENFKSNLDYVYEGVQKIFDCIRYSKFLQHSTLMIVINGYCLCYIHVLELILFLIRNNEYLRYKSKLIILNNVVRCPCRSRFRYIRPLEETELNCGKYDNTIIFFNDVQVELDVAQCYLVCLLIAQSKPRETIAQILTPGERSGKHECIKKSTNVDLYFYNINPALAIIVNNYYFTSPQQVREGSEYDVLNLMRELKTARIPFILIEDCDRAQLLQILEYIERKDFQPLKSFLFFIMSHGDSNDIIYTHDGQLNIRTDVVEKIQANPSLDDVETLIVLNACRGPIDLEYATCGDLEQIKPSDASHLKRNTILLYSVPDRVQSPRCPREGCPLIWSFCQNFHRSDHTHDIRIIGDQINSDLQKMYYFDGVDTCSELLTNSKGRPHNILKLPSNAVTMLELIDSILKDFPISRKNSDADDCHKLQTMFHICGTLNERKFPKLSIVEKYFNTNLDVDKY